MDDNKPKTQEVKCFYIYWDGGDDCDASYEYKIKRLPNPYYYKHKNTYSVISYGVISDGKIVELRVGKYNIEVHEIECHAFPIQDVEELSEEYFLEHVGPAWGHIKELLDYGAKLRGEK